MIGRLDDIGADGIALIGEIVEIYNSYPDFTTEILVASVRNMTHVVETAKMGAHVATRLDRPARGLACGGDFPA